MAEETIVTNIVARSNFSDLIGDLNKVSTRLSTLQSQLTTTNRALANQAAQMQKSFATTLRSTGQFSTHFVSLASDVDKFGKSLDSGQLKLGQYYGAWKEHSKTAGGLIRDLAKQQVMMQNAVLQPLGKNAQGLMQFNVHVPQGLDEIANKTKIASQEMKIMNKVIQDGANQVINWGKNTQWAGRQLTMGLTLPIVAFGASAQKAFLEADQQLVRLTKVYGGVAQTSAAELKKVRAEVSATARDLAAAYGASYKDTISLAADIAATGKTGNELLKSTAETTRLSILGEVDRQEAMKATLAIQTAFKQNTTQLGESINFLNAVENQTSTSLQDLVDAIPKAGPVIQAMGGSIKDLALYMTAMKEGGISASEGANALKSAMASLVNPTKVAKDMFAGFGIDLGGIVTKNAGNLTGTILELQGALDKLDPLQKQQAIEQLFGKFQFARMNALFANLGKQGSQTLAVLDLMKASSKDLANIASREMTQMTESASGKYKRALETLKADMAGVGDQFLTVSTRVLNVIDGIIKFFNHLPKPIKNIMSFVAGLTAIAGPVIMLTGLLANFFGYIAKGMFHFKAFLKGGEGFKLLTPEILAAEQAGSLMEKTFYSDAKAAVVLKNAISNLTAELSLLETKANSATVGIGPAIQTSAGTPLLAASQMAGSQVVVDKSHPLVGQPYTRQMAHLIPKGMEQPQTIFGVVPNPGPVNQKISKNLQMYANVDMPMVPGLSSIRGVNTGIIPQEAAKWHAMTGALAMQSEVEIKALKAEVYRTGTVSNALLTSYEALLPQMTQLTQKAADESAIIVGQLEAGKLTVDAAKAKIAALNIEVETMMGQVATSVAATQGRTVNLNTVPLTQQPVVDSLGKSNMKELFHKGSTASFVNNLAGILGVRTSGAGYSRETTMPRVTIAPFLKRNKGGGVYKLDQGPVIPGPASDTTDTQYGLLPEGSYVINKTAAKNPPPPALAQLLENSSSRTRLANNLVPVMLTPGEKAYGPDVVTPQTLPLFEAWNNRQNTHPKGMYVDGDVVTERSLFAGTTPEQLRQIMGSRFKPRESANVPSYIIRGTAGNFLGTVTDPAILEKYKDLTTDNGSPVVKDGKISIETFNKLMESPRGVPHDMYVAGINASGHKFTGSTELFLSSLKDHGYITAAEYDSIRKDIAFHYQRAIRSAGSVNDANNPYWKVSNAVLKNRLATNENALGFWNEFSSSPGYLTSEKLRSNGKDMLRSPSHYLTELEFNGQKIKLDPLKGSKTTNSAFLHGASSPALRRKVAAIKNPALIAAEAVTRGLMRTAPLAMRRGRNSGGSVNGYALGGLVGGFKDHYGQEVTDTINGHTFSSVAEARRFARLSSGNPAKIAAAQQYLAMYDPRVIQAAANNGIAPKYNGPVTFKTRGSNTRGGGFTDWQMRGTQVAGINQMYQPTVSGMARSLYSGTTGIISDASIKSMIRLAQHQAAITDKLIKVQTKTSEIYYKTGIKYEKIATAAANAGNNIHNNLFGPFGKVSQSQMPATTWKELLLSPKGWGGGFARPLDPYGRPLPKGRVGFGAYKELGISGTGLRNAMGNHPMATTMIASAGAAVVGQKVSEKNPMIGNVISTVLGIAPWLLMNKMQVAQQARSALASNAVKLATRRGTTVAIETAKLQRTARIAEIATKTGKSVAVAERLHDMELGGKAIRAAKVANVTSKLAKVSKVGLLAGRAAELLPGALAASGPIGWAIEGTLALGQAAWVYKRHLEDIGKANRAVFGPTKASLKEVGIEYKNITDKVIALRKSQEAYRTKMLSYSVDSKGKLVGGLTISGDALNKEVKRVKDSKSETVQDFNKTYGKSNVLKLAASLKEQYIAAGMSATEATNKVYVFMKASNKASYAFSAITSKAFKGITDQASAADYALKIVVKSMSTAKPEELAVGIDNMANAMGAYKDSLIGTKDANGKIIDQNQAQIMTLEKISKIKGSDSKIDNDTIAAIKKQDAVLGSVLGKAETLQGVYAKSQLLQSAFADNLDIQGMSSAQAISAVKGMDIWQKSAAKVVGKVAGMSAEYDKLGKAIITANKVHVNADVQKALENKIKLEDELIKKIQDETNARLKALEAEKASADFATSLKKEQIAYQNALATGDMSGAAQAQLNIQALVKQKQIDDAKQAITDAANAKIAKAEAIKTGAQNTITTNQDIVAKAQADAANNAASQQAIGNYLSQVDNIIGGLTAEKYANKDTAAVVRAGIKSALADLKASGTLGAKKAGEITNDIQKVGLDKWVKDLIAATNKDATTGSNKQFADAVAAFVKAVADFASPPGSLNNPIKVKSGATISVGGVNHKLSETAMTWHTYNNDRESIEEWANQHGYTPGTFFVITGKDNLRYKFKVNDDTTITRVQAGYATGGAINGYSRGGSYSPGEGGYIRGAGTPTSDSILLQTGSGGFIRASDREFMQPASAVSYYGTGAMEALRSRSIPKEVLARAIGGSVNGYATGGPIPGYSIGGDLINGAISLGKGALRSLGILPKEVDPYARKGRNLPPTLNYYAIPYTPPAPVAGSGIIPPYGNEKQKSEIEKLSKTAQAEVKYLADWTNLLNKYYGAKYSKYLNLGPNEKIVNNLQLSSLSNLDKPSWVMEWQEKTTAGNAWWLGEEYPGFGPAKTIQMGTSAGVNQTFIPNPIKNKGSMKLDPYQLPGGSTPKEFIDSAAKEYKTNPYSRLELLTTLFHEYGHALQDRLKARAGNIKPINKSLGYYNNRGTESTADYMAGGIFNEMYNNGFIKGFDKKAIKKLFTGKVLLEKQDADIYRTGDQHPHNADFRYQTVVRGMSNGMDSVMSSIFSNTDFTGDKFGNPKYVISKDMIPRFAMGGAIPGYSTAGAIINSVTQDQIPDSVMGFGQRIPVVKSNPKPARDDFKTSKEYYKAIEAWLNDPKYEINQKSYTNDKKFIPAEMGTKERFLAIAKSQIGVHGYKAPQLDNGFPILGNDWLNKYGIWANKKYKLGDDLVNWCGEFIAWVAANAGVEVSKKMFSAPKATAEYKKSGNFKTAQQYLDIQPGDIMWLDHLTSEYTPRGVPDHATIVEKVNKKLISFIAGGTGNGEVYRDAIPISEKGLQEIYGFARPKFKVPTGSPLSGTKNTTDALVNTADTATATGMARGGLTPSFNIPRFEQGINMVPADMLAMIHKDEAVVPANMNPFNPNANGNFGGDRIYQIAPVIHAAPGMDEQALVSMAVRQSVDAFKTLQYNESRANGVGRVR